MISFTPLRIVLSVHHIRIFYIQGCQLPDFSLRSQTFCYTADFSTTFLYMLKTKTFFAHCITKPPVSTLDFKNFHSILQKKIIDFQTKTGKRPHPAGSSCAWAGLWLAVTRMLSTSRSFQTSFRHNVGNPIYIYHNSDYQYH